MAIKKSDELLAVARLQEMQHLVNDDVFEEVFRLLHQLGVQADRAL